MDEKEIAKLAKKKPHDRTEAEWEAIYDAESLARAEQIKADPDRLAAATTWAKVLLSKEKAETVAMEKVANT